MRPPRPAIHRLAPRRLYSSSTIIKENDVVFLRQKGERSPKWHLTAPLRPESRVRLSYGAAVNGADLIGRKVLDEVRDSKGRSVTVHAPSMASYIINNARHATPIYPHDATTIVSLLDINLPRPGEDDDDADADADAPPFEIFEAGTGMGSLTLHLARALHAGNPPVAPALRRALIEAPYKAHEFGLDLAEQDQAAHDAYRASRRAVLHTLDRSAKHSRSAHTLVRNFRRALYFANVDFHVGSVAAYLAARLAETRQAPFLAHAVLDLPSADEHAAPVVRALRPNGQLVVFNPSISQIADFRAWAVETRQPLRLERVLELPVSTTADGVRENGGGKEWDLKTVVPRADEGEGRVVQVMRPRVGDKVAGGGFVGVFRRWPVPPGDAGRSVEEEHLDMPVEPSPHEPSPHL